MTDERMKVLVTHDIVSKDKLRECSNEEIKELLKQDTELPLGYIKVDDKFYHINYDNFSKEYLSELNTELLTAIFICVNTIKNILLFCFVTGLIFAGVAICAALFG